jgi:hypothetical protein
MRESYPGWTAERIAQVNALQSNGAMAEFAMAMLATMPQPICQVCGPMTTGGRGSFEENLKVIDHAIRHLRAQGKSVFDQQPYQVTMQRLKAVIHDYHTCVLEEFYLPIFRSGYLTEFHFVPDWQSSVGARWEFDRASELGIGVYYLSDDLFPLMF